MSRIFNLASRIFYLAGRTLPFLGARSREGGQVLKACFVTGVLIALLIITLLLCITAAEKDVPEIFLKLITIFFSGEITLEKLDARHMELFEWMCSKLDNGRWGFRRDFERLASKYTLITPEQCEILRNEQASGRSPSRLLMSFLQVSYPDLPLSHFVHTLKAIGRLDIVQKLIPLI